MADGKLVVDGGSIDRLARIDRLDILQAEGKTVVVTPAVYEDLQRGAFLGDKGSTDAVEWLKTNEGRPWLEFDSHAAPGLSGKETSERSIADYVNREKAAHPSADIAVLTDDKKDWNGIAAELHDKSTPIKLIRDYAGELAARDAPSKEGHAPAPTGASADDADHPRMSAPARTVSQDPAMDRHAQTQAAMLGGDAAARRQAANVLSQELRATTPGDRSAFDRDAPATPLMPVRQLDEARESIRAKDLEPHAAAPRAPNEQDVRADVYTMESARTAEQQSVQQAHAHQSAQSLANAANSPGGSAARASATQLNDPDHPDHALYRQARARVYAMDAQFGRTPDQRSDNLAASLTVAAKSEGLNSIDKVTLSDDGSKVYATSVAVPNALSYSAGVPTMQAMNTPIAQSTARIDQANLSPNQQAQVQAQAQAREQQMNQPVGR